MYSYGQLPLKQHRSEPHGATYKQILSVNVQPAPMSLGASQSQPRADRKSCFRSTAGNPWMWRADCVHSASFSKRDWSLRGVCYPWGPQNQSPWTLRDTVVKSVGSQRCTWISDCGAGRPPKASVVQRPTISSWLLFLWLLVHVSQSFTGGD